MSLGVLDVAKKKSAPVGRPKAAKPLYSLVSLKGSEDLEKWIDALVDRTHLGTRSLLIKNALRVFAEQSGVTDPMPKR